MPRHDKSGPMGSGPKTGKGFGYCKDHQDAGNSNMTGQGFGRGRGHQRGFGRGMGMGRRGGSWGCFDQQSTCQSFLEKQAEVLKSRLDAVKQQLKEFEPTKNKDS